MNKDIMKTAGFKKEIHEIEEGICPFCKNPIKLAGFRDAKSVREFNISGLCQGCQDNIFGK